MDIDINKCVHAVRNLATRWKFEDLVEDPKRKHLLLIEDTRICGGEGNLVETSHKVHFRTQTPKSRVGEPKGMPDWRMWFNTPSCMIQWRTGRDKDGWDNHRLVVTTFSKEAVVSRIPLGKFFKDPTNPSHLETQLLVMAYPELLDNLHRFTWATGDLQESSDERYTNKLKQDRKYGKK